MSLEEEAWAEYLSFQFQRLKIKGKIERNQRMMHSKLELANVTIKCNEKQKTELKLFEEKKQWNKMTTAVQANINIMHSIQTQS